MIQLSCNGIKKYYGAELILKEVTFEANEGERIAFIGKNGTGKTTLFKLISGIETADGGSIAIRKGAAIGYLEQQPVYPYQYSVQEILETAFSEQFEIKEQLACMENSMGNLAGEELDKVLKRYGMLSDIYEQKGGYEIEERFSRICSGLKLEAGFLEKKFGFLSGGEKTLAGLAKVLLLNPDILVMDEPTNHLDMSMLQWLEEYISGYKGTILLISHDRYFLDTAANRILEICDGILEEYKGNYSYYLEEKQRRREEKLADYKEQQKQIKAMEKAVKQMRIWAAQANNEKMFKRAFAMQKRIDRIDRVEKPKAEEKNMAAAFAALNRSGKDVLAVDGISKAYGENVIFRDMDFLIYYKEHVALIGRNGCGKTTLLRIILGEEAVDGGQVRIGASLQIGYLPQQIHFQNEELTILETFREDLMIPEGKGRELLARYLFFGDSVFKKVKNLSGGEKSRLYLAKLMQKDINFLILDEPTNHLDISSRESLEEALLLFKGTILFVSHDRYFINRISTRILEFEDKKAENYIGGYDDYRQEKEKKHFKEEASKKEPGKISCKKAEPEPQSVKKKSAPVNSFRTERLESDIAELEGRLADLEKQQLVKQDNYAAWMALEDQKQEMEKQLETWMGQWMELVEKSNY